MSTNQLYMYISSVSLLWRHNGRDDVSNHQPHDCLFNPSSRRRSKKISKLRVTGLCAGNSPVTGEFPAQMASNAENVTIWWRHHVLSPAVPISRGQRCELSLLLIVEIDEVLIVEIQSKMPFCPHTTRFAVGGSLLSDTLCEYLRFVEIFLKRSKGDTYLLERQHPQVTSQSLFVTS